MLRSMQNFVFMILIVYNVLTFNTLMHLSRLEIRRINRLATSLKHEKQFNLLLNANSKVFSFLFIIT